MSESLRLNRRHALKAMAAGAISAPAAFRAFGANKAPSQTLLHASFGASGMAGADLGSITASPHVKLVAVADVDLRHTAEIKKRFPDVRVYQDWRELLDKEKHLDSANISTPDHMHAPITMSAMNRGIHVYTQKPLTRTIHEARRLAAVAGEKKLVTQMGIQIHSHEIHKTVVATIHSGVIGKVKEVHSWSGKFWGDPNPLPKRTDKVPQGFNWDLWLGVAADRPFVSGVYHPGEWRKRIDFGTGTFGDMGCHILDPVFGALGVGSPLSVKSTGGTPNRDNWAIDDKVTYVFPGTKYTAETVTLQWYDGNARPPAEIEKLIAPHKFSDQGSVYIGEKGVMYSPYIDWPKLLPADKFEGEKLVRQTGEDHYLQFVEACRGNGKTSTPFSYAGPLTEVILLGCLATRFHDQTLEFDTKTLTVTNNSHANELVRPHYRKGWNVDGM